MEVHSLTNDDIAHCQKIIVTLDETIRTMDEIDEDINKYGRWPGCIQVRHGRPGQKPRLPVEQNEAEPDNASLDRGERLYRILTFSKILLS